jgi:hypothetical protein
MRWTGIERGHRLLEDHADLAAADLADFRLAGAEQVAPLEMHVAAEDPAGRLREQTDDRHGGDALAAAGLADDADGLPLGHGKRNLIDGAQQAAVGLERGDEFIHLENVIIFAGHGSSESSVGSGVSGADAGASR